jgi:N-acetylglucosamine kinase-like BadF-type ATPase
LVTNNKGHKKCYSIVAVDGGGSKTRALAGWVHRELVPAENSTKSVITDDSQEQLTPRHFITILGSHNSGPGNARSVGFELAQSHIQEAINGALEAALTSARSRRDLYDEPSLSTLSQPSVLCLSLAGVGREADRLAMQSWGLSKGLSQQVLVTTDADPLLAYLNIDQSSDQLEANEDILHRRLPFSLPPRLNAISLISGTGSFCFGSSDRGEQATCGGWGGLLGDEGGGYWFAIEALKGVTRYADGRGQSTKLTEEILKYLGLDNATDLIGLIYNSNTTRDQIAKLAGIVFALAHEDQVAKEIVDQGAEHLAELIATVGKRLEFAARDIAPMIGLAGGNFCNQPVLLQATLAALERRGFEISSAVRIFEPALGGFVLASQLLLDGET